MTRQFHLLLPVLGLLWAPVALAQPTPGPAPKSRPVGARIVRAAERYLGKPYVFGGRDGRRGCLRGGKRVACPQGIDCQSLIFFAYEAVLQRRWTHYSVMPSVCVARQQLGAPVAGLAGVLRAEVDPTLLQPGDVLFFLLADYNLDADPALMQKDGVQYGVWHTGLVHSRSGDGVRVIHAKPGERVVIEALADLAYEALFVVRWPARPAEQRKRRN